MKWKFEVKATSREEIQVAIKDSRWQQFRLGLKGISTVQKLKKLRGWLIGKLGGEHTQVQVDNYINALLRGGQLVRRGDQIVVQR